MAKVTPVLRYYKNENGKKAIYMRISHKGVNRYKSLGIHIPPSAWSDDDLVRRSMTGWVEMNQRISEEKSKYEDRIYDLERSRREYTVDDVLKIDRLKENMNFIEYARDYCKKFRARGSINSFRRHKTIINKLEDYTEGDLAFEEITVGFLGEYENHLSGIGNSVNTIHGNLKVIRAILYQAIREGIFPQEKNPFFTYKLTRKKTYKEKLTEDELDRIRELEIERDSFLWHTRNFFLASFNLYGVRFADLCRLTGQNLQGDRVSYEMSKTGRKLSIGVTSELRMLLGQYHSSLEAIEGKQYLFPILRNHHTKAVGETKEIASRNAQVNSYLKDLASRAEIKKNISFHIARHTFADITRKKGVDVYDISKMLGHSSVKQTETYLASLDTDSMDKAARKVYG